MDDEIVTRAAQAAGVSTEVVHQAEHTQPLIARILEPMAGSTGIRGGLWGGSEPTRYTSTSFHGSCTT